MPSSSSVNPPILTRTERALWWIIISLGLALAANAMILSMAVDFYVLGNGDFLFALWVYQLWTVLLISSVVPGFVGFWLARKGRNEFGAGHALDMRRGTLAFLAGAVSATLFFSVGVLLGLAYIPGDTPIGFIFRAVHGSAPEFSTIFVGLFLLWTSWSLGNAAVRGLCLVAFIAAVVPAGLELILQGSTLLASLNLINGLLLFLSVALWIVAYFLVARRLRNATSSSAASSLPA